MTGNQTNAYSLPLNTYIGVQIKNPVKYNITNVISPNGSIPATFKMNNILINYSISEGTFFTYQILNTTQKNILFSELTVELNNGTNLTSQFQERSEETQFNSNFVYFSFPTFQLLKSLPIFQFPIIDNSSILPNYMPALVTCNSGYCSRYNYYYNVTGDVYTIHFERNHNFINKVPVPNEYLNYSVNWRTGLLEYASYKYGNIGLRIERINQENIFNTIINYLNNPIIFSLIIGIGIIAMVAFGSFTNYTKKNKLPKNSESFKKFIQSPLSKKKSKSQKNHNIDKSLEIIEDLIKQEKNS